MVSRAARAEREPLPRLPAAAAEASGAVAGSMKSAADIIFAQAPFMSDEDLELAVDAIVREDRAGVVGMAAE